MSTKMKQNIAKVALPCSIAAMSMPVWAADTAISNAFTTAAGEIKAEVLSYIPIAVTAGLAIVGATIGIKKGIAFLKTMVNKA